MTKSLDDVWMMHPKQLEELKESLALEPKATGGYRIVTGIGKIHEKYIEDDWQNNPIKLPPAFYDVTSGAMMKMVLPTAHLSASIVERMAKASSCLTLNEDEEVEFMPAAASAFAGLKEWLGNGDRYLGASVFPKLDLEKARHHPGMGDIKKGDLVDFKVMTDSNIEGVRAAVKEMEFRPGEAVICKVLEADTGGFCTIARENGAGRNTRVPMTWLRWLSSMAHAERCADDIHHFRQESNDEGATAVLEKVRRALHIPESASIIDSAKRSYEVGYADHCALEKVREVVGSFNDDKKTVIECVKHLRDSFDVLLRADEHDKYKETRVNDILQAKDDLVASGIQVRLDLEAELRLERRAHAATREKLRQVKMRAR